MAKPILIGISPNTTAADISLAKKLLFRPWLWQTGPSLLKLKQVLADYFGATHVFLVNAGRSGLYLGLKALKLKPGDEVMLQAFTCVAVPNSVLWTGAIPVYVDIDQSLTMNPVDLERKITKTNGSKIIFL